MKTTWHGAITYFIGLWSSIPILYAVKGNFSRLFTMQIFPWFLLITILLAGTSFMMYVVHERLSRKYQKLLPVLWVMIPLIIIALHMQAAFQAIHGHTHGLGYISGLGDAKTMWLVFSGISVFCSIITYWFIIRKNSIQP